MNNTGTTKITIDIPNELVNRIHSLLEHSEDADIESIITTALDEYLINRSISIGVQNLINLRHLDVNVLAEIVKRSLSNVV